MPSIQVTGVLEDPITGVESDAEIRIISKINYGQTTKNSDSITVLSSSGVYDFQLVYGKHLIAVKSKDSQVFTNIGTVVVGEGSPSPIDIITLIATSSEEPDPILITQLQLIAAEAAASADEAAQSALNAAQSAASASDDADRAEAAALTASSGVIDRGSWDASTGSFPTPTLTPEERTDWYRISVAGVMSDGVQPDIDASVGDNLYWDKQNDVWYKIDNTDKVNSVNGKEGDVVLDASDFDDIYSKTEVDNALLSKADSSDVYLKTETYSQSEVDNALLSKADSSDVYLKTETYSQSEVDSALSELSQSISYQIPAYDPDVIYSYGDIVYKIIGGIKKFFQWYSNVESLAGKDPELDGNRQTGWIDDTKPFYWTPFKGSRPGTPLWPWMSMTFPEGTLNVLGNSVPVSVFWRLAEAFPEFVNAGTGMIDFPETGGEFFRVLDQGRGVDTGREFNNHQKATIVGWNTGTDNGVYALNLTKNGTGLEELGADAITISDYPSVTLISGGAGTSVPLPGNESSGYAGAVRSRNLAFPILVEV
ncbi:hypothetical protein [Vibrio paracholerae]|uniref:hypothetical protein n=1 Tax=Vibrio paracholerae TaxID=650003 RepID=UPI0020948DD1|nr:hypothetical protein [Vibrio paracholerae]MCO7020281.1 hypothetical protein [Vibrio paracholerae]